jgi:hypothetical protein
VIFVRHNLKVLNYYHTSENVNVVEMLWICVQKVPDTNLGHTTGYSE